MECPQNLRLIGLSSTHFNIRTCINIDNHESERLFVLSILNHLVECFGNDFKLTINSGLCPLNLDQRCIENNVTMHLVFGRLCWLTDVGRCVSKLVAMHPSILSNTVVSIFDESNAFASPFVTHNKLSPTYYLVVKNGVYLETKVTKATHKTDREYSFETLDLEI